MSYLSKSIRGMKFNNLWCIGVAVSLWMTLLTACVPKQDGSSSADNLIKLSPNELTLSSELSQTQVAIEVPSDDWDAFLSNAEDSWLKLERKGKELIVTAQPNYEATLRRAKVVVIASGASAHLTVSQSAAQAVLDAGGGEILLTAGGGTKTVQIRTNDRGMKVDARPADWLELQAIPSSGILIAKYAANLKDEERSVDVEVSFSDGSSANIKFSQASQLTYYLPFEGDRKNLDFAQFIQNEQSRGFALARAQQAAEGDWFASIPDWLEFNTFSSALPSIVYTRDYEYKYAGKLPYAMARIEIADVRELERGKGYRQWLTDLGYRDLYGSTDTAPVLESADMFFLVKTKYDKSTEKTYLEFYPQLMQTQEYPTFGSFPFMDEYLRIKDAAWTYAEVKAFHDERGDERIHLAPSPATNKPAIELYKPANKASELVPDRVWYDYYYLMNNRYDTDEARAHEGQIKYVSLCYMDHNKILYTIEEGSREYKCTKEFIKLAESAGFDYQGVRTGGISFTHRERRLDMLVTYAPGQAVFFGDDDVAILKFSPRISNEAAAASTSSTTSSVSNKQESAPVAKAGRLMPLNLR